MVETTEISALQEKVTNLTSLLEVTKLLSSTLELPKLLELTISIANNVMRTEACSLMLIDENTQELTVAISLGEKAEEVKKIRLKIGEGIAGWVAKEGKPIIVPDVSSDPRFAPKVDQLTHFQTKAILCVPLKYKDKVIGVLEVINKSDGSFNAEYQDLLEAFASQAAVAIENARYVQKLVESNGYLQSCLIAAKSANNK